MEDLSEEGYRNRLAELDRELLMLTEAQINQAILLNKPEDAAKHTMEYIKCQHRSDPLDYAEVLVESKKYWKAKLTAKPGWLFAEQVIRVLSK